ncbi:3598_t:CDS:10, partial [Ambispora gerdemannii]
RQWYPTSLWSLPFGRCLEKRVVAGWPPWTSSPVYLTILVSYVSMVSALWPMLGEESCSRVASLDLFSNMDFCRYVSTFASDTDSKDWNFLNCLQYLKDYAGFQFTSDSKQNILDAFIKVFKRIGESGTNREKKKAKKIHDSAKTVFQKKEISEFFEELNREFIERRLERSFDNNGSELLIKSGNFQTLNHSLRFKKRSAELKRKYETEDEISETSCEPKSYRIRSSKSNISTALAESEVTSGSTTSDQTYNPSSDSEGSTKAKRSFYLDYFIGPGEIDWELKEDSTVWVIGEVDISKICMEYRTSVIQKCKSKKILSTDEELALSHIFLFQEENPQELHEYFDDESWQCVFSEIRTQYPYIDVPERVFDLCGTIVKIASQEQDPQRRRSEIKNFLRNYRNSASSTHPNTSSAHFRVDRYQNSFVKNNEIEDTHSHNYVDPVIKPFFPEGKKTTMDWANKTSKSSAQTMKQFDPILSGSKPDFTIRTINSKKFVELMFAEIKPPNTKEYLVNEEDLVTLGKTMRASLDKSLENGVDLVICGLHVFGYLGRCYIIDLRYDGIYRMILVGEFRFPEDPTTWGTLMGCFQVMATMQNLVNEGATKYQYTRKGSKQEIPINLKFKKSMFHFPMK